MYKKSTLTSIVNLPSIAPERINVKLNWSHTSYFSATSSIPGTDPTSLNIYRCNSVNDPNWSSQAFGEPNKSAIGHATLSSLYGKYIVHGLTIYSKFNNFSRSDILVNIAAFKRNGGEPTDQYLAERQQYSKTKLVSALGAGANNHGFMKTYIPISQLIGFTKTQYGIDDNCASSVDTDPSQLARLIFQYFVIRPADDDAYKFGLTYSHQFVYNVTYFQRRKLTADQ